MQTGDEEYSLERHAKTAQIQPQVTGYLMKQNYAEGTVVHQGEVLFEIAPRPFEAALQQAKGQLAQAEAQLVKTRLDVANEAAQAMVSASNAQVEQAQLNLEFTKVKSLVDGVAGMAKGQIGDLVGPTTILTTVSQIEPIKAYFAISEQQYLKLSDRISAVAEGRMRAGKQKILDFVLSDGTGPEFWGPAGAAHLYGWKNPLKCETDGRPKARISPYLPGIYSAGLQRGL